MARGRGRGKSRSITKKRQIAEQEVQRRVKQGIIPIDTAVYPSGLDTYCPHKPSPQQQAFLDCDAKEAMYGGAAGGGKTDALLMDALVGVNHPRYSALILRRTCSRLEKPGSIMNRMYEWMSRHPKVVFNRSRRRFTFPSGAVISFGYLEHLDDRFQYQSAEYQYIAFDELTEFTLRNDEENPWEFMFSRLRATEDINMPTKMRAATNPGGIGHTWVKNRFITPDCQKALDAGVHGVIYVGDDDEMVKSKQRAFIPAKIEDNVALKVDEYKQHLERLSPIVRRRLLHGDWSVQEASLFDPKKFKYYYVNGEHYKVAGKRQEMPTQIASCNRFATVDTAGTTPEHVKRGKEAGCYSVMAVWDYCRDNDKLYLVYVMRNREPFVDLCKSITRKAQAYGVSCVYIEKAHFGDAVHNVLEKDMSVRSELLSKMRYPKGFDKTDPAKVKRATALLNRFERGGIYFPESAPWLQAYESELMTWTGDPEEESDQIDVSSYAAMQVEEQIPISMQLAPMGGMGMFDQLVPQYLDSNTTSEMESDVFSTAFDGDCFIGL